MSRCFPFPPPGYERKHTPEDLNLLKEAKRKEKKHKKEKKDKERKKDKEKEKEGGNEKHREKKKQQEKHKDRKDKHKDKKKANEDRGKEKEKSSISEEAAVSGKVDEQSEGKLLWNDHSKNSNLVLSQSQNGGKPLWSSPSTQRTDTSRFVQEPDKRNRDEKRGKGSQFLDKVEPMGRKDQETTARNSSVVRTEETADLKIKRVDRKIDPQGPGLVTENVNVLSQSKLERISRPMEQKNCRGLQDKEKYKEVCNITPGHKQKDKENHGKEKDKEKERRMKDAENLKDENKKTAHSLLEDDARNNPDGAISNAGPCPGLFNNTAVHEAYIRKRKDMDTNGLMHDNEIRPHKIQKPAPAPAPHQSVENGRKLKGYQTPCKLPPDKHVIHNNIQVDKRDQLANGIVEAHRPSPSKQNSSAATFVGNHSVQASKLPPQDPKNLNKARKIPDLEVLIGEASKRPPHPDSKYLSDALSVPKMEEWSEIDEQDWLFNMKDPSSRASGDNNREDPCVWSEAVRLESVDVCALPYVIPY
ncbi:uncharacterized protein LOC127249156 [Andrographis paniculata]|uniref:uncharacterized protein LOC127249156 n=1 Tax=Andrographis paniculata TaxID=175694 RepID=UPI0021E80949|nr:uncharacterized protein LOC127249156 [Andrographis paniculata]XP_051127806.1 uncharacterized protein LOC127249156 [Andrographis paniculata]XP_051127807.1 uncharacterized protein LOC127249156 [Andrographis paniculata]